MPDQRAGDAGRWSTEELLLRAAWYYYKDELTQDEIARRLSMSRASVGRLLDRARRVGLVSINLNTEHLDAFELSGELRKVFGLAEALVCAAARETFEESGVLFAGPADDPDGIVGDASVYRDSRSALADRTLSFADFLRRENLVLRSDLLRPWANWVTPEAERTRRYDTYFFVGALPEGQRADGDNTESDRAEWVLPQDAIADFAAGRNVLLPPTWTQLDALAGRTVADVLAVERQIVPVQPILEMRGDNWVFEFFDSDRYHQARESGGFMGWPL